MNIHEHFGCMSRSINDLSTSSYEFCKKLIYRSEESKGCYI